MSNMNKVIVHPVYFGSIAQWSVMIKYGHIIFENEDNYQKQTYRNRMHIYGANGKLTLSIPIRHSKTDGRQRYADVRIENDFDWQKQHWKSLETAYRTSPFFEYYEAYFEPLYQTAYVNLMAFNYDCMQAITQCLQLEFTPHKTEAYQDSYVNAKDYRHLVVAKKEKEYSLESYGQVFIEKYGFICNLSVFDLLCNMGPQSITYLQEQYPF